MKKTLIKILAAALAMVLILGSTACIHIRIIDHNTEETPSNIPYTEPTEPTLPTPPPETPPQVISTIDYPLTVNPELVPVYEEHDLTKFNTLCTDLTSLAKGNDFEAIKKTYDALCDETLAISDNASAAYLNWCQDGGNDTLSKIYQDADDTALECFDQAYIAIRAICEGPCSSQFKNYVGEYAFNEYSEYEDMTEEDLARNTKINELVADYFAATERYDAGEIDMYELNDIVGPIYLELIQLRTQQAQAAGYDNYAEYADAEVFCRSYSTEEAEKLHAAAKKIAPDVYEILYYSDIYYMPDLAPYYDEAEMLTLLKEYAAIIDPDVLSSADFMINNGLIDIAQNTKRQNVSFTLTFDRTRTPYIFINESGNEDFSTLNHEFGHFTATYLYPVENPMVQGSGDFDVLEIHSTGLEVLYSNYYGDIYGTEVAPYMEAYELINLLFCVVDGAMYDEFQREIYTHPDMTLDEINQLYYDLSVEYGDPYANYYWWQQVPHNFESPMYYISYGASALASVQLWDLSKKDYGSAVSAWKNLLSYNGHDSCYMEALTTSGLATFDNQQAILNALWDAVDYTDKYSVYSGSNY